MNEESRFAAAEILIRGSGLAQQHHVAIVMRADHHQFLSAGICPLAPRPPQLSAVILTPRWHDQTPCQVKRQEPKQAGEQYKTCTCEIDAKSMPPSGNDKDENQQESTVARKEAHVAIASFNMIMAPI
ncbi:MAG: hypothetical protein ACRD41_11540, partial [Candidatus Acidiferrales bacterium]